MKVHIRSIAWAIAAAALLGCPPETPPAEELPAAPEVLSFAASAAVVARGDSVTLTWSTQNATSVELREASRGVISGATALSGSVSVTVDAASLFVITARNERGVHDAAAVSVRVFEAADEVLFVAVPAGVVAGETALLAWTAPGAREVALSARGGDPVDIGSQLETGSVHVKPTASITYVLTVDEVEYEAAVKVVPRISAFASAPTSANRGEPLTISWQTVGATKVTLYSGARGVLHVETDAGGVADGTFEEVIPADVDPAAALGYRLVAESADGATTEETLVVYVAGAPAVRQWNVPEYALIGGTFTMSWQTTGADAVEIAQGGVIVYRTTDAATVATGSATFPTPAEDTGYILYARQSRGGSAQGDEKMVNPVGLPTVNTFTASPQPGIQYGGDPVTLTWNVDHARDLEIVAVNQFGVHRVTGIAAETGSVVVYPNKDTEYLLTADNGLGDETTANASATVTTPATLTWSASPVPDGAQVQITGTSPAGLGDMYAVNFALRKVPGDGFVDIAATGTVLTFGTSDDTTARMIELPEPLQFSYGGDTFGGDSISVSVNGWMVFSDTAIAGASVPGTTLPSTSYVPFAIIPWGKDLQMDANAKILWQLDGTGTTRRLIVQWEDVPYFAASSSGKRVSFQAQLYGDGQIVFAYKQFSGLTTSTNRGAIGIVNHDETGAIFVPNSLYLPNGAIDVNDTYRFFGRITVPQTHTASAEQLVVRVDRGNGSLIIEDQIDLIPPGEFVISEINYNPVAGQEEWFELTNIGAGTYPLAGWTLDFGGGNVFTLPAGTPDIQAGQRLVFGQSASAAEGLTVDVVYGTQYVMPDAAGSISLGFLGATYATAAWTSAGTPGVALVLEQPNSALRYASGVTALNCPAVAPYGSNGQLGTPGSANNNCFPYALSTIAGGFQSIAGTGTLVGASNAGTTHNDVVTTVTLPRAVRIFGQMVSTLYVSSNGFVSTVSPTNSTPSNNSSVSTSSPNGVIAPFWDDLQGNSTTSSIRWQQFDPDATPASGDEYTLVSWENWKKVSFTSALNFQIRFVEGTGDIEFHYGNMTASTQSNAQGSSATTWLENPAGNAALAYNVNSSTAPGIQANSGIRFTHTP